jgi:RND family efflux transporter MFP subunit
MGRRIMAVLAGALLLAACGKKEEAASPTREARKIPNVEVETVTLREMTEVVLLPGTVIPDQDVLLTAEVSGVLERVGPAKGDLVKAGDFLAEVDRKGSALQLAAATAALERAQVGAREAEVGARQGGNAEETAIRAVEQARLGRRAAETTLTKAELALANQRRHHERMKRLHDEKLVAQAAFDDASTLLAAAEADAEAARTGVAAATESVRLAEGNLAMARTSREAARLAEEAARTGIRTAEAAQAQARLQHDKAVITAPFDAWVDQVMGDRGEYVKMESPLFRLIQVDPVKVRVAVAERDVPFVRRGDAARVIVTALEETFPGKVTWVALSSDPSSNTYEAEVSVPNPAGRIRTGMVAQVSLVRRRVADAVAAPGFAVMPRDEGEVIFVLEGTRAVRRKVRTGIRENGYLQVLEGLAAGERLIVKGQRDLEDGEEVRVPAEGTK